MATARAASSSSNRSNGRASRATKGAASGESTTSRRSNSGSSEPLVQDEDIDAIVQQVSSFAQKSAGSQVLGPFGELAPTVVTIAGRYARREPGRVAAIVLALAGLYLVGRMLLQSSFSGSERSAPAA